MDGLKRLFDFKGHAERGEYWAISIGATVASTLLGLLPKLASGIGALISLPLICVVLAIHAAAAVRRLHDRGKTGWWALLFLGAGFFGGMFAPLLSASGDGLSATGFILLLAFVGVIIWAFIELGVLPGKRKGNRFVATPSQVAAVFD